MTTDGAMAANITAEPVAGETSACPRLPFRWRMGQWREREACRAERVAGKLMHEAEACMRKGPAEVDCTGFIAASDKLKEYATRLREGGHR